MKIGKICLGGILVLVLLGCFTLGMANAQPIDLSQWAEKWFNLTTRTTGAFYDGVSIKTENESFVVYLRIIKLEVPGELTGVLWQLDEEDGWKGYPIAIKVIGGTSLDFLCTFMDESNPTSYYFGFSARVTGKQSKGVLKSAKFKSLGGFSWEHSSSDHFASGVSISGSFIDPSRLPFTP